MSKAHSARQYMGVRPVRPPDLIIADRAPTSSDKAYLKGQLWLDKTNVASYQWPGSGDWISLGSGTTGAIVSLTGDSGGAIVPVGGNIDVLGDSTDGVSVVGTAGTLTINIAAASTTQRGSLETSTDAESVTGTSAVVAVTPASLTARLAAPGAIGGTTPGAADFTTVDSTGAITAGTTLTATLGDITATNGDLVFGAAGNKIISSSVASTTTAGANSFGTVTLVGGTATISTTAVTASSIIMLTRQSVGSTGANDLGILSVGTIVAGTSFVINAWTVTDATALQADDVSVIGWMIIN